MLHCVPLLYAMFVLIHRSIKLNDDIVICCICNHFRSRMITKAASETQQYVLTSYFLIGPCINIFDNSRRFLNRPFRLTVFARVVRIALGVLLQLLVKSWPVACNDLTWIWRNDTKMTSIEHCYQRNCVK